MRSSWIRVRPPSNDECPSKKRKVEGDFPRDRERRPWEEARGTWSQAGNVVTRSWKGRILPWTLQREHGLEDTWITDLQPPKLGNKCLSFQATRFVVICLGSYRTLTWVCSLKENSSNCTLKICARVSIYVCYTPSKMYVRGSRVAQPVKCLP